MINYKTIKIKKEKEIPASITCDICGTTYKIEGEECFEAQEFLIYNNTCGYGSIFGDGDTIELHMCQHCVMKKLGKYIRHVASHDGEGGLGKIIWRK